MKLSVIMPVYNEDRTLQEVINKIKAVDIEKEIIIVDDGSDDKTKQLLQNVNGPSIKILTHPYNKGKGAAIKTALKSATGDTVVIQDADLEYDPQDYLKLLKPIEAGDAQIVYGSRFLSKEKVTTPFHYLVNQFLTSLTNWLYGSSLTDMETCYKMFKAEIIKGLDLKSDGFEIEPELTIKALKMGCKIVEVPVSYKSRSYHEGKKIGWLDGIKTLCTILRYKLK